MFADESQLNTRTFVRESAEAASPICSIFIFPVICGGGQAERYIESMYILIRLSVLHVFRWINAHIVRNVQITIRAHGTHANAELLHFVRRRKKTIAE